MSKCKEWALARPKQDWSVLGTNISVDKNSIYVVTPATNQPGVTMENPIKWFIVHGSEGEAQIEEEDVDHCMGVLLEREELDFLSNSETDDLTEAIEAQQKHIQIRIDLDMAFNGIQKIVSTLKTLSGQTHETDHMLHRQLSWYVDSLGKLITKYHDLDFTDHWRTESDHDES